MMASTSVVVAGEVEARSLSEPVSSRATRWLRLSLVLAFVAISTSVLSLRFEDSIYGRETANWAAQAVGQDLANLLAFSAMLLAVYLANRGSVRWYLVWVGLLIYSSYTYAIYAFAVHFGPLFLAWVAVLGLSVFTLIGALGCLDASKVRAVFQRGGGEQVAARLVIGIGSVFALLWLSEIIPATFGGTTPSALTETGLPTNPVHVLDLALLLPTLVIAGVLLRKGDSLGFVLVPATLVATFFLAMGIVSLTIVSAVRGIGTAPAVGVAVALLAAFEMAAATRFLKRIGKDVSIEQVLS